MAGVTAPAPLVAQDPAPEPSATKDRDRAGGYGPLRAGLAFLPITGAIVVTAQFAARSLPGSGPSAS
jgi:hypothetical protein